MKRMVALAALLTLAACPQRSKDSGDNEQDSTPDEPWFEPTTASAAPPNTWGTVVEGLPPAEGFRIYTLLSHQGEVYVSGGRYKSQKEGVLKLNRQTFAWEWVTEGLAGPLAEGSDGNIYMGVGKMFFRLDGLQWTALAEAPINIESLHTNVGGSPGRFYIWTEAYAVYEYNVASNTWQPYAPPNGALDPSRLSRADSFAVDATGAIYFSTRWSIRDSQGVLGAAWRFAKDGTAWEDATFNLREMSSSGLPTHMRNMTGNGWGPFGGVANGPGDGDIYASTEQGIFYLPSGASTWEKIAYYWGNSAMFSSPAYLFVAHGRVEMFLNPIEHMLLGQTRLYACKRHSFKKLTAPDTSLVVGLISVEDCSGGRELQDTLVALRIDPGAPVVSRNLELTHGSYLGGPETDQAVAVEWVGEGSELVAAANVGGKGALWRKRVEGTHVSSTILEGAISDMDVSAVDHSIVVVGDQGLVKLPDDLSSTLWTQPLGEGDKRVAVDAQGTIAVITGKTVALFNADGSKSRETTLERAYVTDLDISASRDSVYVVGFDNQRNGEPVQVPFLLSLSRSDLSHRYKTWGYNPDTLDHDMADSRLYRVVVGGDDMLYVLGELAGGNTVFRWNGRDLQTNTLVKYDLFNDAQNTASEHKLYYARLDPVTGDVLKGQLAIPRLSNGKGNTFRAGALDVDEHGRMFIGGACTYAMAGRDLNLVNGQPVGTYAGGDPAILVVSPDFSTRMRWTTLCKDECNGKVAAMAVKAGHVATLSTNSKGGLFTTDGSTPHNPAADDDLDDVHLSTWVP